MDKVEEEENWGKLGSRRPVNRSFKQHGAIAACLASDRGSKWSVLLTLLFPAWNKVCPTWKQNKTKNTSLAFDCETLESFKLDIISLLWGRNRIIHFLYHPLSVQKMALQKIKLHFIKSRAKERFLKVSCKVKKSSELTLSSLIAYFHWAPWPSDASRPVSRHCQPNSPPPHRANSEVNSEKSWILLQNLFFFLIQLLRTHNAFKAEESLDKRKVW